MRRFSISVFRVNASACSWSFEISEGGCATRFTAAGLPGVPSALDRVGHFGNAAR